MKSLEDNKIGLQARICTEPPDTVMSPVKVLFVIDSSYSMWFTDPTHERKNAVNRIIDKYRNDPSVSFGIIVFNSNTALLTEGYGEPFTRDPGVLESAITYLNLATSQTDYIGAMGMAAQTIRRDLDLMGQINADAIPRTRYVVVFLSDGAFTLDMAKYSADPKSPYYKIWETCYQQCRAEGQSDDECRRMVPDYNACVPRCKSCAAIASICNDPPQRALIPQSYLNDPTLGCPPPACASDGITHAFCTADDEWPNPFYDQGLDTILTNFLAPLRILVSDVTDAGASFELHTFQLAARTGLRIIYRALTDQEFEDTISAAERILQQMAAIGNGTFQSFSEGGQIDFSQLNYASLASQHRMKSFFAFNLNAIHDSAKGLLPDSDGDGLSDDVEAEQAKLGYNKLKADSDDDGCSDLVEYRAKVLNPKLKDCQNRADSACTSLDQLHDDTDGDGLTDCEELWLGTTEHNADTDGDGIPDGIELRIGTNPLIADAFDDKDLDGVININELMRHADPLLVDPGNNKNLAYTYETLSSTTEPDSATGAPVNCYDIRADNISLVQTLDPAGGTQIGQNKIELYFTEASETSFAKSGKVKKATITVTYIAPKGDQTLGYRNPAESLLTISPSKWLPLGGD